MTQQIYTTPTPFSGTNISIPNSGKGYTSNMVIKGQTYQNLVTENNGIDVFKASNLKPNTKYTIIVTKEGGQSQLNLVGNHSSHSLLIPQNAPNGTYKATRQTDSQDTEFFLANVTPNSERVKLSSFIVLEGDYTNKEVPSSITGIESVGEKENNKISILSHNKNLVPFFDDERWIKNNITGMTIEQDKVYGTPQVSGYNLLYKVYLKANKTYTVLATCQGNNLRLRVMDSDNKNIIMSNILNTSFSLSEDGYYNLKLENNGNTTEYSSIENLIVQEGSNASYEPPKEDKKEILIDLDGGLKSLPDGVADTIEQKEDGVYLVQRIKKLVLNGFENWGLNPVYGFVCANSSTDIYKTSSYKGTFICSSYKVRNNAADTSDLSIWVDQNTAIRDSRANTVNDFKKLLQANPVTIYYELATAIETKLDINNLNLETFKDLTYISSENNISPILEFKAPILRYKEINPIQLKTTQNGTEVNVYPYSTPELITFGDNETLADKINNLGNTHKHNNATVTSDGFMSKESYAKLESLTEYTHPATHPATMISQDASHRFVTDAEKNTWNAKASTNIATSSTNGLMSNTDKQKIDRISNNFDIVYDANTETIRFRFR